MSSEAVDRTLISPAAPTKVRDEDVDALRAAVAKYKAAHEKPLPPPASAFQSARDWDGAMQWAASGSVAHLPGRPLFKGSAPPRALAGLHSKRARQDHVLIAKSARDPKLAHPTGLIGLRGAQRSAPGQWRAIHAALQKK